MVYGAVRLIVNADDLGMSEEVNEAILDGLRAGRLSATSLLANGPAAADAARRLAALPGASVGVHLNLTEFAPLSGHPGLAPLLTDGALSPAALRAGPAEEEAVYAEWCAQVQRALDLGLQPDHLDSHQHLHHRPALWAPLRRVIARFGLWRVRRPASRRPEVSPLRALPQRLRSAAFARRLRQAGGQSTDGFGSASLFRTLAARGALPAGSFEIMVHPGNPAHARYADELDWLAGDWRAALPGSTLISWRQL